jgi:hypothetical protein
MLRWIEQFWDSKIPAARKFEHRNLLVDVLRAAEHTPRRGNALCTARAWREGLDRQKTVSELMERLLSILSA